MRIHGQYLCRAAQTGLLLLLVAGGPTTNTVAVASEEIRPYSAAISDYILEDLQKRIEATRWPDQLPETSWEYGADIAKIRTLADHWATSFDWRAQERRINSFDQFTTEIDGQRIHFIHQRSLRDDATPLLLLHGWPGSIIEYLDLIGPLANPDSSQAPAFHVIAPSLPGFGLSGPTSDAGWSPRRMASALLTLISRLDYERIGIHGEDWGSIIAQHMARQQPDRLTGLHLTLLIATPPSPEAFAEMTDEERYRFTNFQEEEFGYFKLQETRPQTAAYALTDSPVGWLAWTAEKFHAWTDHGGNFEAAVSRDQFLANITLYWVTETIASSMRIYREGHLDGGNFSPRPRFEVPVGHFALPREVIASPDRWTDAAYNVVHRTRMQQGGHFAALEQPTATLNDIRTFFQAVNSEGDRQ